MNKYTYVIYTCPCKRFCKCIHVYYCRGVSEHQTAGIIFHAQFSSRIKISTAPPSLLHSPRKLKNLETSETLQYLARPGTVPGGLEFRNSSQMLQFSRVPRGGRGVEEDAWQVHKFVGPQNNSGRPGTRELPRILTFFGRGYNPRRIIYDEIHITQNISVAGLGVCAGEAFDGL